MSGRRRLRDVKATQAAKKRRAKKRKRMLVLVLELLILFVLLGIGYIMMKYDKFQINSFETEEIHVNEGISQEGYTTVALFGGDSREGELEAGTHADSIMLVSIDDDTKEVKIVSVYRDLLMEQMDGEINKANHAYYAGGPKEAIGMLNKNLDLDIREYVSVDFGAMADAVDLLGGLEMDLTEAEADEMNKYIAETAMAAGKESEYVKAGNQTLDGVQAVTYARIRKNVGDDYGRTERQRLVIQKLVEKIKEADLFTLNKVMDEVFSQVSTSFSMKEILGLALSVSKYEIGGSSGYPFKLTDGTVQGIGSAVIPLDVANNVKELHKFLYPKDAYAVSETAETIAQKIEAVSGYTGMQ